MVMPRALLYLINDQMPHFIENRWLVKITTNRKLEIQNYTVWLLYFVAGLWEQFTRSNQEIWDYLKREYEMN